MKIHLTMILSNFTDVFAKAGLVSCLDYYNERHVLKLC